MNLVKYIKYKHIDKQNLSILTSRLDIVANYLIYAIKNYNTPSDINYWKHRIPEFIPAVVNLKTTGHFPAPDILFKYMKKYEWLDLYDVAKSHFKDDLDHPIDIEYYDIDLMYECIQQFFNWMFTELYKNGMILEQESNHEIDRLVNYYNSRIDEKYNQGLQGIARIGFTNDSYEVYVNTDDPGDIPYFHYRKKSTWEGHTCIRLDKPEYFQHGDKQATLNSKQRKELVNFLQSKPSRSTKFDTNWEYLINEWNTNNSSVEIPEDTKMPDYNKLSTSKDKVGV